MKPTPIEAAYFYQSVNINQKECFSVNINAKARVSARAANYELFWGDSVLHIKYENGEMDLVPPGNIKKMVVDVSKAKELWQKEERKSPQPKAPQRRGRQPLKTKTKQGLSLSST